MVTFDIAFERVVGHEGKFQNDPRDRGNWTTGQIDKGELKGTKFGISAASYPHLDIKNLTLEQAKDIYFLDFWNPVKDLGDDSLIYQLFDASFHHGIRHALRMLQRAVGVKDDGIIGPVSRSAIASVSEHDVLKLFLAERLEFMTDVTTFLTYGRGWSRRIAQNLRYAAEDTVD